jgi:UDP-glucose 4-epimerase
MNYLITGANGFIGSYLSKYLIEKNHNVVALSRNFHKDVKLKLVGAEFHSVDILDGNSISDNIFSDVETIIHLASANDQLSKNRKAGIELSAVGTSNLLDLAVANNVKNFIFFSTLQVYGVELIGQYDESKPILPENDYAINHFFGEEYVKMYSELHNLNSIILRPSNVFGEFISNDIDRWSLVPGCLIKEAFNTGEINLLSSGNQNRNFISLNQVCFATEKISNAFKYPFDIINLVSDHYLTIGDVAQEIVSVFKEDFNKIIKLNIQSDLPKNTNIFRFSNQKIKQYGAFSNESKTAIRDSINKIISSL